MSRLLSTDYAARVRLHQNALLLSSDDLDIDELSDEEIDTPRTKVLQSTDSCIRYAAQHPRRPVKRTNYLHFYRAVEEALARPEFLSTPELVVPIKVELEIEGYKLRDSFLWNVFDPFATPEKFAEIFCFDLNLHPKFIALIALSIKNQIEEFAETRAGLAAAFETCSPINYTCESSLSPLAQHLMLPGFSKAIEIPNTMWPVDDVVVVDLEVFAGGVVVRDRFEWDINCCITPETFARITCADLGLTSEFAPLIATAVREQLLRSAHQRVFGGPADMRQIKPRDAGIVQVGARDEWAPSVEFLDPSQIDRHLDRDKRETRRVRRVASRTTLSKIKMHEISESLHELKRVESAMEATFSTGTLTSHLSATSNSTSQARQQLQTALLQQMTSHNYPLIKHKPHPRQFYSRKIRHDAVLPPVFFARLSNIEGRACDWHCSHCYIDGSRTLCVRADGDGNFTLCAICSALLKVDGELPISRKDKFIDCYVE